MVSSHLWFCTFVLLQIDVNTYCGFKCLRFRWRCFGYLFNILDVCYVYDYLYLILIPTEDSVSCGMLNPTARRQKWFLIKSFNRFREYQAELAENSTHTQEINLHQHRPIRLSPEVEHKLWILGPGVGPGNLNPGPCCLTCTTGTCNVCVGLLGLTNITSITQASLLLLVSCWFAIHIMYYHWRYRFILPVSLKVVKG